MTYQVKLTSSIVTFSSPCSDSNNMDRFSGHMDIAARTDAPCINPRSTRTNPMVWRVDLGSMQTMCASLMTTTMMIETIDVRASTVQRHLFSTLVAKISLPPYLRKSLLV